MRVAVLESVNYLQRPLAGIGLLWLLFASLAFGAKPETEPAMFQMAEYRVGHSKASLPKPMGPGYLGVWEHRVHYVTEKVPGVKVDRSIACSEWAPDQYKGLLVNKLGNKPVYLRLVSEADSLSSIKETIRKECLAQMSGSMMMLGGR